MKITGKTLFKTNTDKNFFNRIINSQHQLLAEDNRSLKTHYLFMNNYSKFYVLALIWLTGLGWASGQEKERKIETEVIRVEKDYTPTLREAIKIRQQARLDSIVQQKINIRYAFPEFPVASTFVVAKAKPSAPPRLAREKVYSHYASFGAGSFGNVEGDFYGNYDLNRTQTLGYHFNHFSSQGGIDGVELDDDFYDTKLGADFMSESREKTYRAFAEFSHQFYNWYGVPDSLPSTDFPLPNFDEGHNYFGAKLGGEVVFENAVFQKIEGEYKGFFDDFSSSEHRFTGAVEFRLPISDYNLDWRADIDWLNGRFDRNFLGNDEITYNIINLGVLPTYRMTVKDWTFDLGIKLYGNFDTENNNSDVFLYPNVLVNWSPVAGVFRFFGAFTGGLKQNSYREFAQTNPFVSPTLLITPTDTNFELSAGISGNLSSSVTYTLKGAYSDIDNYAFFSLNPFVTSNLPEAYTFGNSLGVVYDGLEKLEISGRINATFQNTEIQISASVFDYSTDNLPEAFHLPELTASLKVMHTFNPKWKLTTDIFYVNERKDQQLFTGTSFFENRTLNLDSYIDANLRGDYRYNDRWSFFGRINNLLDEDYERYANYPVQGIQFMAGAMYRFHL